MQRLLLLTVLFTGTLIAQQSPAPKTMLRMDIILQTPDAVPGSFASKPKIIYRAGTQFCRFEEVPDPEHGMHSLLIVNEPDVWMVNLEDNTAQHDVDPGPTFNCHLPVFPRQSTTLQGQQRADALALEFGNELAYFKSHGATAQKGPVLQTKETMTYHVTIGEANIALFVYGPNDIPLAIGWVSGNLHDIIWYSGYGELGFNPALFSKPEYAKIVTPKPPPPPLP